MISRRLLIAVVSALLAGAPVWAADPTIERILRDLRGLGYSDISVERTLLGRTRILADSREATREIIVNPATGEILRDLWIPHVSEASASGGLVGQTPSSNSGSGSGSNSGSSGSGSSGSGSSGSGSDDDTDDDDDDDDDNDGGKGRGRGRGGG